MLDAALNLLVQDQQVFEEYQEDAPAMAQGSDDAWVCPVSFAKPNENVSIAEEVLSEMALLQPWYDKGLERRSTSVGVSGMDLDVAVNFVSRFVDKDAIHQTPDSNTTTADLLKYAVEDIKAFYNEAATSQPGTATVKGLEDWYWGTTSAGKMVRAVKQACADHEDGIIRIAAGFLLVPGSQSYRDQSSEVIKN